MFGRQPFSAPCCHRGEWALFGQDLGWGRTSLESGRPRFHSPLLGSMALGRLPISLGLGFLISEMERIVIIIEATSVRHIWNTVSGGYHHY